MPENKLEQLIDSLALAVGKGFAHIDEQFDGMRSEFAGVNVRLDGVEKRLETMDARLGRVESHTTGQFQRLEVIEDRVRQLATKIGYQFN